MALQVAQRIMVQSSGTVASVTTSGATTTSGNLLVACCISFGNHIGTGPISDSKGNTWSQAIAHFSGTTSTGAMEYVANCTGGSSHTFTLTASGGNGLLFLIVYEISGAATSSVLGSTSTATNNTGSHDSGNITSGSTYPEIFIGMCGWSNSDTATLPLSPTPGTDWSGLTGKRSGANEGGITAFRIVGTSVTDSFKVSNNQSLAEAIMVAGFKDASVAASTSAEISIPYIG